MEQSQLEAMADEAPGAMGLVWFARGSVPVWGFTGNRKENWRFREPVFFALKLLFSFSGPLIEGKPAMNSIGYCKGASFLREGASLKVISPEGFEWSACHHRVSQNLHNWTAGNTHPRRTVGLIWL